MWLHKESSLKKNYGVALHKGDKVTYRRKWGIDSRFIVFYGVKYKGKCLWVSSRYSKLVKLSYMGESGVHGTPLSIDLFIVPDQ